MLDEYGPNHEKPWPQGVVRPAKHHPDATLMRLQPILMTYRGLDPTMRAFELDTYDCAATMAIIDARPCIELTHRAVSGNGEDYIWVDAARGFGIIRYLSVRAAKVDQKADVQFALDSSGEWVPKTWRVIFNFPTGGMMRTINAEVTSFELGASIPSGEFDLEFPLGTRVSDEKRKVEYIVKPDGSGQRLIPRSDFGATYEDMLKSAPGNARNADAGQGAKPWPIVTGIVVAIVSLTFLYWRRRRG